MIKIDENTLKWRGKWLRPACCCPDGRRPCASSIWCRISAASATWNLTNGDGRRKSKSNLKTKRRRRIDGPSLRTCRDFLTTPGCCCGFNGPKGMRQAVVWWMVLSLWLFRLQQFVSRFDWSQDGRRCAVRAQLIFAAAADGQTAHGSLSL